MKKAKRLSMTKGAIYQRELKARKEAPEIINIPPDSSLNFSLLRSLTRIKSTVSALGHFMGHDPLLEIGLERLHSEIDELICEVQGVQGE